MDLYSTGGLAHHLQSLFVEREGKGIFASHLGCPLIHFLRDASTLSHAQANEV
jgi:hypothetical protein